MKLAKLSLAAMVVAGLASSSFAADTLADAFKQGSVNGELKAYYFANDNDGDKDSIFTTGLLLGYKTASFYGLSANFTFQGSASPFADSGAKGDYSGDMYGSGAQLSEAYLAYSVGKTTALIGRMFLDTPLVATSGSRVVKDSFEGAALINTDLPNTTLIAGYVQKKQIRTDGEGIIGKFSKVMGTGSGHPSSDLNDVFDALGVDGDSSLYVDNGAFTLAAINKSIAGLTLTAAYAQAMDVKNFDAALTIDNVRIAYGEAAYAGAAGNFTYGLAAQYYFNSYSGVNGLGGLITDFDNNSLWGVKASVGYGAFGAYAAYTKVGDKDLGIVSGIGNGADLAYTMSPIMSDSYANDTKAYKVGLTYALLKNANLGVNYTQTERTAIDTSTLLDEKIKNGYAAVEADYAFEGALKGLTTSIVYEDGSKDASDLSALWFKAGYKF